MIKRFTIDTAGYVVESARKQSRRVYVTYEQRSMLTGRDVFPVGHGVLAVEVANRPQEGWMYMIFFDHNPRYMLSGAVLWCRHGLRRLGIRAKDGGQLWVRVKEARRAAA